MLRRNSLAEINHVKQSGVKNIRGELCLQSQHTRCIHNCFNVVDKVFSNIKLLGISIWPPMLKGNRPKLRISYQSFLFNAGLESKLLIPIIIPSVLPNTVLRVHHLIIQNVFASSCPYVNCYDQAAAGLLPLFRLSLPLIQLTALSAFLAVDSS